MKWSSLKKAVNTLQNGSSWKNEIFDPTAVREAMSGKYNTLVFPRDIGVNTRTPHYVLFHINETIKGEAPKGATRPVSDFMQNPGLDLPRAVQNTIKDQNKLHVTPNIRRITDSIALYMPHAINYGDQHDWNNSKLGALGDVVMDLAKADPSKFSDMSAEGLAANADFWKGIGSNVAKGVIQDALIGMSKFGNIAGNASANLRMAINPHLEVLYTGTGFRKFAFHFHLVPRNEDEQVSIDKIIRLFRTHAAPEIEQSAWFGRWYRFPSEFDIQFMTGEKENEWLPKISTCALTGINTSFGPNRMWVAHENRAPISTDLSLEFVETEIIHRERIKEGY